jgi:septal ring factor EnvC (AmiA/AmiB activator)
MTRSSKALTVVLVASLGLWGCAQNPSGNAQAERIKALEAKCAKAEEDYRAVAAARDQIRKRTAALEEERTQTQKELVVLKGAVKERDELRQQINLRQTERDQLQARCDRLKKGLQSLLGQDDAMAVPAGPDFPSEAGVSLTINNPTQGGVR